ncbi:MAG: single-stranded DNA-binding protein [Micrococcales bacterium]|nr:single-stranded DNA-binding protein [Micrococcales bacterium]
MNETYVTVCGNVVAPVEMKTTGGSVPFASFRIASTVRKLNPSSGQFEDSGTSFYRVAAFRRLGLNVGQSIKKGDPVIVHGRQRVNQWARNDGTSGTSVEIDAYHVGHDLTLGVTTYERPERAMLDPDDRLSDAAVQAAMDAGEGLPPIGEPPEEFEPPTPGGFGLPDPETVAFVVEGEEVTVNTETGVMEPAG